jgi:hypothetical protein
MSGSRRVTMRLVPPPLCAGQDRCAISFHPALQEVLEVLLRPEWSRSAHEGEKFNGLPPSCLALRAREGQ